MHVWLVVIVWECFCSCVFSMDIKRKRTRSMVWTLFRCYVGNNKEKLKGTLPDTKVPVRQRWVATQFRGEMASLLSVKGQVCRVQSAQTGNTVISLWLRDGERWLGVQQAVKDIGKVLLLFWQLFVLSIIRKKNYESSSFSRLDHWQKGLWI